MNDHLSLSKPTQYFSYPPMYDMPHNPNSSLLELLLENTLESDGVRSELADTLAKLLSGHLVFVQVEAEGSLVLDVGLLLDVKGLRALGIELLGNGSIGVEELVEEGRLQHIALV